MQWFQAGLDQSWSRNIGENIALQDAEIFVCRLPGQFLRMMMHIEILNKLHFVPKLVLEEQFLKGGVGILLGESNLPNISRW